MNCIQGHVWEMFGGGYFPDYAACSYVSNSYPLCHDIGLTPDLLNTLFLTVASAFLRPRLCLHPQRDNGFLPALLRYNWHIILCKFKVYSALIWYTRYIAKCLSP